MSQDTGFLFSTDTRDLDFVYTSTATVPPIKSKMWWADGWWGNQRSTPQCCAYTWLHFMEDGPTIHPDIKDKVSTYVTPEEFYNECKKIDGITGAGTTMHAGAKVAKALGFISEYRWVSTVDDLAHAVLVHGPVVAGTHWYADMEPASDGRMRASGRASGGHAYLVNGVDLDKRVFRVKNSYGRSWGDNGHGWLPFSEAESLMRRGGLFCVPFEVEQKVAPSI